MPSLWEDLQQVSQTQSPRPSLPAERQDSNEYQGRKRHARRLRRGRPVYGPLVHRKHPKQLRLDATAGHGGDHGDIQVGYRCQRQRPSLHAAIQQAGRSTGPIRKPLTPTKHVLIGIGDGKIKPKGTTQIDCSVKQRQDQGKRCLSFYVTEQDLAILGRKACQDMNLVKRIDGLRSTTGEASTKEDLIKAYQDLFHGVEAYERPYHIQLRKDVDPVIQPARRFPYAKKQKLQATLARLQDRGIIADVDGPTEWVHNLVVTEKKNGRMRLCLDPRPLNKAIRREHYRLPTPEDVQTQLSGIRIFTVVDMRDAFWHVKLSDESSYLCTFNTPWGRKRFLGMPFGISSASEVLQQRNDDTFGGIPNVSIVADDLIIAGKDEHEHDAALIHVMERAKAKNASGSALTDSSTRSSK